MLLYFVAPVYYTIQVILTRLVDTVLCLFLISNVKCCQRTLGLSTVVLKAAFSQLGHTP